MKTNNICLIGPSLSHDILAQAYHALGTDLEVTELQPSELDSFLHGSDYRGFHVAAPYRRNIIPLLDKVSPVSAGTGSVDTVVRRDGMLCGYDTAYSGFIYMTKHANIDVQGKKILILGEGAEALTANKAYVSLGCREVKIISREALDDYSTIKKHTDADIIVNTTEAGSYPHNFEQLIDLRDFPRCSGVIDVIGNPHRSALVILAEELGIPCSGGLPMLAEHIRLSEAIFSGRDVHPSETIFSGRDVHLSEAIFSGHDVHPSESDRILSRLLFALGNIVIIGMPGSGKTSTGLALSRITGRECIDIDDKIIEFAGMSIPEIFSQHGEPAFRNIESTVIRMAGMETGKIIVTGGGSVLKKQNYGPLHQNGCIFQIDRDIDLLSTEGRPLSCSREAVAMMMLKRAPLYRQFRDAKISNDRTIEETASAVLNSFKELSGLLSHTAH